MDRGDVTFLQDEGLGWARCCGLGYCLWRGSELDGIDRLTRTGLLWGQPLVYLTWCGTTAP